jgi:hypothetical protein
MSLVIFKNWFISISKASDKNVKNKMSKKSRIFLLKAEEVSALIMMQTDGRLFSINGTK